MRPFLPLALPPLALLALATPLAAQAQSLGCIERPVGPGMDVTALVPLPTPRLPRGALHPPPAPRAAVTLPDQPMHGTECIAVAPPPQDILRGDPPPQGGLLRTDDGRSDLLRGPAPARPAWR